MNQNAEDRVTEMLNFFPQTAQNYALFLATLERQCASREIGDAAVVLAADRFAGNLVQGQSTTFAPSGAAFIEEVVRCQEVLDIKARPRIAPPEYRRGILAPFEVYRQRALAANSHRPVIAENASLEMFRNKSKAGELPAGSSWIACLGIIYGPEPKQAKKAA